MFVVATETDHIAPWRSSYKTQPFTNCHLTFILTSGGHNSGIVNQRGTPRSPVIQCTGRLEPSMSVGGLAGQVETSRWIVVAVGEADKSLEPQRAAPAPKSFRNDRALIGHCASARAPRAGTLQAGQCFSGRSLGSAGTIRYPPGSDHADVC